jgi:hypothetical protein
MEATALSSKARIAYPPPPYLKEGCKARASDTWGEVKLDNL